jgi:hypothetical protein
VRNSFRQLALRRELAAVIVEVAAREIYADHPEILEALGL